MSVVKGTIISACFIVGFMKSSYAGFTKRLYWTKTSFTYLPRSDMSLSTKLWIRQLLVAALTSSCESYIIRGQHKNLEIHHISKSLLVNWMNALKDYDWCRFYFLQNRSALMQIKIISWDFAIIALEKLIYFIKC